MKESIQFGRGFDHGNYANAYDSQDWHSWFAGECDKPKYRNADYYAGVLLGFFSSYELSEIGDETIAEEVDALRKKYDTEVG